MNGNTFIEKDIEDYLWDNPGALDCTLAPFGVSQWVERQMRLPSGIADLVGICNYRGSNEFPSPIVVELKLNQINSDALTKVSRYAADIEEILDSMVDWPTREYARVSKMVIGSQISNTVFAEAQALGISVLTYSHSFSFGGRIGWTHEYLTQKRETKRVAAMSESFQTIKLKVLDPISVRFASDQDYENEQQQALNHELASN